MPPPPPYLSIVIASRNDDHAGGMTERMRACVHGILDQSRRHGARVELVLVEWNPPPDRPPLKDLFDWTKAGPCVARVITVPPEVHRRYAHWEQVDLHWAAAQNVGIRRARGQFVLITTADLLFSDALFRFFAEEKLEPDGMYRMTRRDVRREALAQGTIDERLAYCEKNVIRVAPKLRNAFAGAHGIPDLHTMAAGDFQLLSRDRWHALRGIPEADITGMGFDCIQCYRAHRSGAREIFLEPPMALYHIDHEGSISMTASPLGTAVKNAARSVRDALPGPVRRALAPMLYGGFMRNNRFRARGVPHMTYREFQALIIDLYRGRRTDDFNDAGWGQAGAALTDTEFG
jgi:hypothetical protein